MLTSAATSDDDSDRPANLETTVLMLLACNLKAAARCPGLYPSRSMQPRGGGVPCAALPQVPRQTMLADWARPIVEIGA